MAAVPVYSLYGEPAMRHARPDNQAEGSARPAPGGVEYVGRGRCQAGNDTCQAWPVKGGIFCFGHGRAADKALAEQAGANTAVASEQD